MGHNYTHLPTQDPSELLSNSSTGNDISILPKWTTRFNSSDHTSHNKMYKFSRQISEDLFSDCFNQ